MNSKYCWYQLKINRPVFNSNWKFPEPNHIDGNGVWRLDIRKIFSEKWLNYIKNLKVPISHQAMIFYRPAYFNTYLAHIDVNVENTDFCTPSALNWVIEGGDSDMVWYELPTEEKEILYTVTKTPYINWPVNELKEIDRTCIQSVITLSRVDVPHSIIMRSKPRWAFSIRLKENGEKWNNIVDMFRDLNLLTEREC